MAFPDAVLADQPLFYLRCNELTGSTVADATGNGHPGALHGTYTLGQASAIAPTGKAIVFGGGRLEVAANAALTTNGDFTIELIERHGASSIAMVFGNNDAGPPYDGKVLRYEFDQAIGQAKSGAVTLRQAGGSNDCLTVGGVPELMLNDNVYRHQVYIRRGLKLEIWIDGVLRGEKTLAQVINGTQVQPITLMNSAGGEPVMGALDEAAYYDYALSPARILAHAQLARDLWRLGGVASLDTGAAASKVLVRHWATHAHVSDVVPAVDGEFEVFVPAGDYDVTVIGPAGYQPITHGPVAAVEPE